MTSENNEIRTAVADIATLLADVADTAAELLSMCEGLYNRSVVPETRAKGRSLLEKSQKVRALSDKFRAIQGQ